MSRCTGVQMLLLLETPLQFQKGGVLEGPPQSAQGGGSCAAAGQPCQAIHKIIRQFQPRDDAFAAGV